MATPQNSGRFILVLTNETNKIILPVKENMLHGKKIKGDFLLPLPGKTRREFHYSNTSDDMTHKLIEAHLTFSIMDVNPKLNTEFILTAKTSLKSREIITYYQPLPLTCEKSKKAFNDSFKFTSGVKQEYATKILYMTIKENCYDRDIRTGYY